MRGRTREVTRAVPRLNRADRQSERPASMAERLRTQALILLPNPRSCCWRQVDAIVELSCRRDRHAALSQRRGDRPTFDHPAENAASGPRSPAGARPPHPPCQDHRQRRGPVQGSTEAAKDPAGQHAVRAERQRDRAGGSLPPPGRAREAPAPPAFGRAETQFDVLGPGGTAPDAFKRGQQELLGEGWLARAPTSGKDASAMASLRSRTTSAKHGQVWSIEPVRRHRRTVTGDMPAPTAQKVAQERGTEGTAT